MLALRTFALVAASAALGGAASMPAPLAGPQPPLPVQTATPAAAAACAIPYVVGEQMTDAQLSARFSLGAIKGLAGVPDIQARAGRQVIRSAYAGVVSQAMSAVLDAYRCKIKAHIEAQNVPDGAAKLAQVDDAIAAIRFEIAVIQNAAAQPAPALSDIQQAYLARTSRPPTMPAVDRALLDAALADLDPEALFIRSELRQKWAGLHFGSIANVSACGGVVKAAISDGGSLLQRALADVKPILINYLDKNVRPITPLAQALVAASATPYPTAAALNATNFRACSVDVAAHPPAPEPSASATATPAPSASAAPTPGPTVSPVPAPSPSGSPSPASPPTPGATSAARG